MKKTSFRLGSSTAEKKGSRKGAPHLHTGYRVPTTEYCRNFQPTAGCPTLLAYFARGWECWPPGRRKKYFAQTSAGCGMFRGYGM